MTVSLPVTLVLRVHVPDDEDGVPDLAAAEVVAVERVHAEATVTDANESIGADPEAFEAAIRRAMGAARG